MKRMGVRIKESQSQMVELANRTKGQRMESGKMVNNRAVSYGTQDSIN
jgi:hypothetical protein